MITTALGLLLLVQAPAAPTAAAPVAPAPAAAMTAESYPFKVGERFQYAAKLGFLRLGTAWLSVTGIDTVRGAESFVFEFGLETTTMLYKSKNVMQSWTGTADLISRKFHKDMVENSKPRQYYYDIFPDSQIFVQEKKLDSHPSVSAPLDDAAFFYFLRTVPLEMGKSYSYDRYFQRDLNPVTIKVAKREKMKLPDGSQVNCVILNPVVGSEGVFAPRAEAMLWMTDDARRIPVQIRSKLPFGTVTLVLEKMSQESASK
jgi:hypothetical protein